MENGGKKRVSKVLQIRNLPSYLGKIITFYTISIRILLTVPKNPVGET